jgi:phosphoribosyl-ATP pyrophosphohydrolase
MTTISKLTQILQERKVADPQNSYVSSLYSEGLEKILAKISEESAETLEAAREAASLTAGSAVETSRNAHLVHEVADLWFHTMVMLVHLNQDPKWVLEELESRFGISGHIEKASR